MRFDAPAVAGADRVLRPACEVRRLPWRRGRLGGRAQLPGLWRSIRSNVGCHGSQIGVQRRPW